MTPDIETIVLLWIAGRREEALRLADANRAAAVVAQADRRKE